MCVKDDKSAVCSCDRFVNRGGGGSARAYRVHPLSVTFTRALGAEIGVWRTFNGFLQNVLHPLEKDANYVSSLLWFLLGEVPD